VDYNTFFNWSSTQSLVVINTFDHIILKENTFEAWVAHEHSFLVVRNTPFVEAHGIIVKNTTFDNSNRNPFLSFSTEDYGKVFIENCEFYGNYVPHSAISIERSVGNLTIQNCDFHSELMSSSAQYVNIENPYTLMLKNLSFDNVKDIHDLTSNALLVKIEDINLNRTGNATLDGLYVTNSPVSLFSFHEFKGSLNGSKHIFFNDIRVNSATYDTRNDLVIFGPFLTTYDVHISLKNVVMKNLIFTRFANILHLIQQMPNVFTIENWNFTNLSGGNILIEPLIVREDSYTGMVNFSNVRAYNNDFKFSTFIVLNEHVDVSIYNSQFYQNSAKFQGVVLSITQRRSFAHIYNSVMNRNTGLYGGVLSIDGNSHIDVINWNFTGNFAVTSSIANIKNEGNIIFKDWEFFANTAISIGIMEIFNSITTSSFENISILDTEYMSKEAVIIELENKSRCLKLWFASDDYIEHLLDRKELLGITVRRLDN
jgi:hypothetical protein